MVKPGILSIWVNLYLIRDVLKVFFASPFFISPYIGNEMFNRIETTTLDSFSEIYIHNFMITSSYVECGE